MNRVSVKWQPTILIKAGMHVALSSVLCALSFVGIQSAHGGPASFGPYTITRTLPGAFERSLTGLTIANGSLYALDSLGKIHQLNPTTGGVLKQWSVADSLAAGGGGNPTGLAWDGNNFWMACYGTQNQNNIHRLTLGSAPTVTIDATYALPRLSWPGDLTYANGVLLYPEYLGGIREINPATGQLSGSLPSPSGSVYGLAFDGQNLLAGFGPGGADPLAGTLWSISSETSDVLHTWQTGANYISSLAYDQPSQTLFIGVHNEGIIVAQVPEPGSAMIIAAGMVALLLAKLSGKRCLR